MSLEDAVREAEATGQTHVQLTVARYAPLRPTSVIRLCGRSGPAADPERGVEDVGLQRVRAWWLVADLRRWIDKQPRRGDVI